MSEGYNHVCLLGNICFDPELKHFQGGSVLKLRVACSDSYYDKAANERKERTEFVNVIVWGARGEALSKFLEKGARVLVEGSLRTSSWVGQDGQKKYKTEIVASNIILNGKASGSGGGRVTHGGPLLSEPDMGEDFGADQGGDDEVPF